MNNKTKRIIILVASVALILGAVGTTLAYLTTSTAPVTNTFTPSRVVNRIDEVLSTDEKSKESVYVVNTGDTDAFIRAFVVVNWVDVNGNVVVSVPDGYRYNLEIDTDTTDAWVKGNDGYYYYTTAVSSGEKTANLITNASETVPENAEYHLSVEILSQAIQAGSFESSDDAWEAALDQGTTGGNN